MNCTPYILQLDLLAEVDPTQTKSTVIEKQNQVLIKLSKKKPATWGELLYPKGKDETLARRNASVARQEKLMHEANEQRKADKKATQNMSMQTQWDLEKKNKSAIQQLKDNEKQKAEEDLKAWEKGLEEKSAPSKSGETSSTVARSSESGKNTTSSARTLPPPRKSKSITVSFSDASKTGAPARNDKFVEPTREDEKKKIGAAADSDSKGISEEQAVFLKDKGDKFLKARVFDAAINAYSSALRLDESNIRCYLNRASGFLSLSEQSIPNAAHSFRFYLQKCCEDCSSAVGLLEKATTTIPTDELVSVPIGLFVFYSVFLLPRSIISPYISLSPLSHLPLPASRLPTSPLCLSRPVSKRSLTCDGAQLSHNLASFLLLYKSIARLSLLFLTRNSER